MHHTGLQDRKERSHERWNITGGGFADLHRNAAHGEALAHANGSFRALLGEEAWRQLPYAVRQRFASDLEPGESVVYHGMVVCTERTFAGWLWTQALRIVGAPLPLGAMKRATSTVVVTADAVRHGQCWTRLYHQPGRAPQVVHSRKLFAGPTGLEEQVGGGIGMALTVAVELQSLVFRSAGYHWRCGRIQLPVPAWLTPGCVEVRHREEREGQFSFVLTVVHPWYGRILRQVAYFKDGN